VVVGVTNEPESLVERHAEKVGMKFPIALISGSDVDRAYRLRGFPTSYLVDARGRIAWSGHPGMLQETTIERLLARSTHVAPLREKDYSRIDKLLAEGELGKADRELAKELEDAPQDERLLAARARIAAVATALLEDAAAAAGEGEYGFAVELYTQAEDQLDGLEAAETAGTRRKAVEDDPAARDELKAYALLAEGRRSLTAGDGKRARSKLASAAKLEETVSGREARTLIDSLD
jgi:hypothetical protein